MQDEINSKVVALIIRTGSQSARLTSHILKDAMRKYLARTKYLRSGEVIHHGKQTIGQLMKQNTGLTNLEITDSNIKSFEKVARKYNIDFTLQKDKSSETPKYLVYFKARDVDVMQAAFKEYTAKEIVAPGRVPIRQIIEKIRKRQDKNRHLEKATGGMFFEV